ncbi:DNA-binding domain-containing protein [Edaphobacter modestus]|uniref:Putative DNA-binding protein n=1 Tax=Edaphobacter modestus TaxID=388466 RepID=A0A4Q7Z0G5_9BACT|nr:DNA-binding domain-containing protein [Edaphobacter modestus]RZU42955.1 putative DNA-binding protein [Edaphobacter modestus]
MNAPELHALQQRMAAAVMRPLTRNEQMRRRDDDNRSLADEASSFIKPNDRLSSFERLEIYNRQYWFRVFSSFDEDFPGLKSIVGTRKFERLMRAYLEAHPSRSFTLRNLGSSLPAWLRDNPKYTQPRTAEAIAMADLEWAHIEAFDSERRQPLTTEEIALLDDLSLLSLQPYVKLVEAPAAVDDALIAVRDASQGAGAQASNAVGIHLVRRTRSRKLVPGQIYLAVHRHEDSVYYKRLAREDYLLLRAFEDGANLGEAIEAAFANSTLSESDRAAHIQSSFHYLMQMGWLCTPLATEPR